MEVTAGDAGDLAKLSYEQALAELDTLISRLEGGAVQLEEAVSCYERGSRLAEHCARLLDRTEHKVTQLVVGGGGGLGEKPFRPEAEREGAPLPGPAPAPGGPAVSGEALPRARPLPVDPDDIPF